MNVEAYRIFFDVKTEGWKAARLHQKAQDALMDVFWEEGLLPVSGVRLERLEDTENGAKKKD